MLFKLGQIAVDALAKLSLRRKCFGRGTVPSVKNGLLSQAANTSYVFFLFIILVKYVARKVVVFDC